MGLPHGVRAAVAAVLLPLQLSSCTSWGVRPESPRDVVAAAPAQVRLTLTTGTTLVMHQPRLVADSIVGVSAGHRIGVSLSQVQHAAVRRPDDGMTVLAAVAGLAAAAVIYVAVVISGDKS